MINILIKSSGCSENNYSCSDLMLSLNDYDLNCDLRLSNAGIIDFDKNKKYNIVIFGSCANVSFCYDKMIDFLKLARKSSPECRIVLWGCSVNNEDSLRKLSIAKLNAHLFKTKFEIIDYLKQEFQLHKKYKNVHSNDIDLGNILVKSGCQRRCSYCIVPFVRRPLKIVSRQGVIKEILRMEQMGTKNIYLCGSCIGDWKDPKMNMDFADLLGSIIMETDVNISGLYLNPKDLSQKLLDLLPNPRILPKWHLPIQSGSDNILRKMNRKYTVNFLRNKFKVLHKKIPNIFIETSIIIGFPMETDSDFLKTLNFIKEEHFNSVLGFIFDSRPMTKAAKMPQLSEKVKIARSYKFQDFCKKNNIYYEIVGSTDMKQSKL